jgi:SHS2 domain-containing protein
MSGSAPDAVREIDHSGDVGLEIRAATRAALFEHATHGLCGLMTWSRVDAVVSRPIEARAPDLARLLVEWLSAVIVSSATHAELYASATVTDAEDGWVRGVLHGEALDLSRHELRFDVKAATYYDLRVEPAPPGYHARVIFDL